MPNSNYLPCPSPDLELCFKASFQRWKSDTRVNLQLVTFRRETDILCPNSSATSMLRHLDGFLSDNNRKFFYHFTKFFGSIAPDASGSAPEGGMQMEAEQEA